MHSHCLIIWISTWSFFSFAIFLIHRIMPLGFYICNVFNFLLRLMAIVEILAMYSYCQLGFSTLWCYYVLVTVALHLDQLQTVADRLISNSQLNLVDVFTMYSHVIETSSATYELYPYMTFEGQNLHIYIRILCVCYPLQYIH